jgi:hypothetical protein
MLTMTVAGPPQECPPTADGLASTSSPDSPIRSTFTVAPVDASTVTRYFTLPIRLLLARFVSVRPFA